MQRHIADKAAAITGACIIYAVQIHADGDNCDLELSDALTDTSSDELSLATLDGDTLFVDYSSLGGVLFKTGLTVDITPTAASAAAFIWTDVNQATA